MLVLMLLVGVAPTDQPAPPALPHDASHPAEPDSLELERRWFIAQILEELEGREDERAGDVFEDVQVLGRHPVGRFLWIMNVGYGRSLGVSCTHCHIAENWSEETREKRITREMAAMTRRINNELLAAVEGLGDGERPPAVNCTTCHRGALKPALNLPDAPER